MLRRSVPARLAFAAVTLTSAAVLAETNQSGDPGVPPVAGAGPRLAVPTPLELFTTTPHAQIAGTIYLERCRSGCTVTQGTNDARANSSTIPQTPGTHTISEYRNGAGQTGALADAEWSALVQCMREVYSPFNVTVTDVRPTGVSYHMAIIAGLPAEISLGPDILGVAPLANDCSPQDNVISFSFANAHPQTETVSRVQNLCWTAAQESAHAFGLDHEYEFGFKSEEQEFMGLVQVPGIVPAPYLAKHFWVKVEKRAALPDKEWKRLLAKAHALVLAGLSGKKRREIEEVTEQKT